MYGFVQKTPTIPQVITERIIHPLRERTTFALLPTVLSFAASTVMRLKMILLLNLRRLVQNKCYKNAFPIVSFKGSFTVDL